MFSRRAPRARAGLTPATSALALVLLLAVLRAGGFGRPVVFQHMISERTSPLCDTHAYWAGSEAAGRVCQSMFSAQAPWRNVDGASTPTKNLPPESRPPGSVFAGCAARVASAAQRRLTSVAAAGGCASFALPPSNFVSLCHVFAAAVAAPRPRLQNPAPPPLFLPLSAIASHPTRVLPHEAALMAGPACAAYPYKSSPCVLLRAAAEVNCFYFSSLRRHRQVQVTLIL